MNTPHTNHILAAYMRASDDDRAFGIAWYPAARELAESLLPTDVSTAAGVLAAMSPMTSWPENIKRAILAINGEHVKHTEPNAIKVLRILSGEAPLDVLSGPKTRAFYLNIMGIDSDETVTVDRHAIDVACGQVLSDSERAGAIRGKAGYGKVADMYREAASIIGVTPCALQAIVWVYWRRNVAQAFHGDA
jgi:hypothetical protein